MEDFREFKLQLAIFSAFSHFPYFIFTTGYSVYGGARRYFTSFRLKIALLTMASQDPNQSQVSIVRPLGYNFCFTVLGALGLGL